MTDDAQPLPPLDPETDNLLRQGAVDDFYNAFGALVDDVTGILDTQRAALPEGPVVGETPDAVVVLPQGIHELGERITGMWRPKPRKAIEQGDQ